MNKETISPEINRSKSNLPKDVMLVVGIAATSFLSVAVGANMTLGLKDGALAAGSLAGLTGILTFLGARK